MAGRLVVDGGDTCFVPRFAFVDGTRYAVALDGAVAAVLRRPRPERPATTEVLAIHPTTPIVPRNLLRLSVWFSAPMGEGHAAGQVRLVDADGTELSGALLPTEYELWDASHRWLTVLLDPARIKRGLVAHRHMGYPLRTGRSFQVVVGEGFRDADDAPLRSGAQRRYVVGDDERRHVDPARWEIAAPPTDAGPLVVGFDRPLDHALITRCLGVVGPDGRSVDGSAKVGPEARSWALAPRRPWLPGEHRLVVDARLEDLAGNSVSRPFDRDLTRPDDAPRPGETTSVAFWPLAGGR